MPVVVITQNDNIEKAISEALRFIPLEPIVEGKLVAVKTNDTWATATDKTAVTQPDTLKAVLRYVKQFRPRELVVTGGAGAGETDEVFEIVGLMEVVKEEGAEFLDHNRPPFTEVALEYAPEKDVDGPQKSVVVNRRVLEYESLIVVSQLKLHATATVTLALKNVAMSFPAADYYGHPRAIQSHTHHFFEDMHSFIAAMAKRFPIDLAVTVGHPAMVGTGPAGGYAAETGVVIASTDAVAADSVGAKLLGFDAQAVRHLWEAGKLGLGENDIRKMEFPALQMKEAIRIFTKKVYGKELSF